MIEPAGGPRAAYRSTAGNGHSKIEYDFKVKHFATTGNVSRRFADVAPPDSCESRTEPCDEASGILRWVHSLTDLSRRPRPRCESEHTARTACFCRRRRSAGSAAVKWACIGRNSRCAQAVGHALLLFARAMPSGLSSMLSIAITSCARLWSRRSPILTRHAKKLLTLTLTLILKLPGKDMAKRDRLEVSSRTRPTARFKLSQQRERNVSSRSKRMVTRTCASPATCLDACSIVALPSRPSPSPKEPPITEQQRSPYTSRVVNLNIEKEC